MRADSRHLQDTAETVEDFDAVVVAIGNYHEPNLVSPPFMVSQHFVDVTLLPNNIGELSEATY